MKLFTIVTVRGDESVLGWTDEEFALLPSLAGPEGAELERLVAALVAQGYLYAWLYGVGRSPEGSIGLVPVRRTAVLAAAVVRVEPHTPVHPVVPASTQAGGPA